MAAEKFKCRVYLRRAFFWCMDLHDELRGTRTEAELILEAEIRRSKPPDLSACRDCPHMDALRSWLRWLEAQLKER